MKKSVSAHIGHDLFEESFVRQRVFTTDDIIESHNQTIFIAAGIFNLKPINCFGINVFKHAFNNVQSSSRYKGFYINAYYFGKGSGTIFVDNLHCNGTEQHINNCTYEISNNCTHDDDVGVVCTGSEMIKVIKFKSNLIIIVIISITLL